MPVVNSNAVTTHILCMLSLQRRHKQPCMIDLQQVPNIHALCMIEESSTATIYFNSKWQDTVSHTFTTTRSPLMQPSYTRPVRPQPISAVSPSSSRLQTFFGQATGLSLRKAFSRCLIAHQLAMCTATRPSCCRAQEAALKAACRKVGKGVSAGSVRSALSDSSCFPGHSAALHMEQLQRGK